MPIQPIVNNPQNLAGVDISEAAIHNNLFYTTPLQAGPQAPATLKETNAKKVARAKKVAKSKLKKKNRKRHHKSVVMPFNPKVESATVYAIAGFTPDLDGNWLMVNVTHHFTRSGSTTTGELQKVITGY